MSEEKPFDLIDAARALAREMDDDGQVIAALIIRHLIERLHAAGKLKPEGEKP